MNVSIGYFAALSAGVLSFLSPCVLSLLPGYLGFIAGAGGGEGGKRSLGAAAVRSLWFVAGFGLIFMLMGGAAGAVGGFISRNLAPIRIIAGIIIITMGLHITGLFSIRVLFRERRLVNLSAITNMHPLLVGMAFAAGWTPCIGPVLVSILLMAGQDGEALRGLLLLFTYSAGLGLPFIISAVAVGAMSGFTGALKRHEKVVSIISGAILVALGILMITNRLAAAARLFG